MLDYLLLMLFAVSYMRCGQTNAHLRNMNADGGWPWSLLKSCAMTSSFIREAEINCLMLILCVLSMDAGTFLSKIIYPPSVSIIKYLLCFFLLRSLHHKISSFLCFIRTKKYINFLEFSQYTPERAARLYR